jgi:hypothetical protein
VLLLAPAFMQSLKHFWYEHAPVCALAGVALSATTKSAPHTNMIANASFIFPSRFSKLRYNGTPAVRSPNIQEAGSQSAPPPSAGLSGFAVLT